MSHEPVLLKDAKVLLVDDTPENLDLLAEFLAGEEYQLSFSTSGEKALQLAALDLPDLILLDVMMPKMDGFETCRRLKSITDTRHIPVIFVTGKTDVEDIALGFEVGGVDYINKPIRQQEVLARVRTQLQLQRVVKQRDELISQLREHNAKQQQSIQQQDQELLQARRLSNLGEMVGEFAHEVNTPVSNCLTMVSFMQQQLQQLEQKLGGGTLKKADMSEFLQGSKESVEISLSNLNHTVELIQSFKRVAVGQCHPSISRFNLKEALQSVLLSLHPRLKKQQHQVKLDCPDEIEIQSCAGALYQIITNLVGNAIQHGFAQKKQGQISISVQQQQDNIRLEVADDGEGMDKDCLQRAFERYFTTKAGQGGSGIGLNLVHTLVTDVMHGEIEVKSTKGQGTTFVLVFPASIEATD